MAAAGPTSASVLVDNVRHAAARTISPEVIQAITLFNKSLPASSARSKNLSDLAAGNACAVVTGQQVGLFLGPLFTYYKALSAIALTKHLEQSTGIRCVPVFWLQVEDHDLEEIATVHVLSKGGETQAISVFDDTLKSSRRSVAEVLLPGSINTAIKSLAEDFGHYPYATETLELLRSCYEPQKSFGQAFAELLAQLFADEGLILINPRSPLLSKSFAPVFAQAFERREDIEAALRERTAELSSSGYKNLVHVREQSPIFFVHDSQTGGRHRIEQTAGNWKLVGTDQTISPAELQRLIANSPGQLSSSALLRPFLQDTILPTACYVGGDAEISYFQQLAPLAEIFKIPAPLAVQRGHFLCVDEKQRRWLDELQLQAADLQRSDAELSSMIAKLTGIPAAEDLKERALSQIASALQPVHAAIQETDPTLSRPFEKTKETVNHAVNNLLERFSKASLNRQSVTADHLQKLRLALFPNSVAQERYFAAIQFILRYGNQFLKERLYQNYVPLSETMIEVLL